MLTSSRLAYHLKTFLAGLAFLLIIALLIGLAVAKYQKVFDSSVPVTLRAERAGLQLNTYADVRMNGVLVGQVRDVRHAEHGAVIDLALEPESVDVIPADVKARILPTTLFGPKYVALVRPDQPEPGHIGAGDVIEPDRSEVAVELGRVLDNVFELLRTTQPDDLAVTLNALATALEGRGERLGETLVRLDGYLTRFNEHLPALRKNIRLVAKFAETYREAAPDLLRILRNVTVTSRTIVANERAIAAFYRDVTGMSVTGERVLAANGDRIIRLGAVTRPVLQLLATYAPEYPCLLKGLARYEKRLSKIYRGGKVHLTVEFGPQVTGYTAEDRPKYGDTGHGPWCLGLPDNPPVPFQAPDFDNGVEEDPGALGGRLPVAGSGGVLDVLGAAMVDPTSGFAGTRAEQQVVRAVLAPDMGVPADRIGDIATLLYGPLVRGTVVSA